MFIVPVNSSFSAADSVANVDVVLLQATVPSLVSFPVALPGNRSMDIFACGFSLEWTLIKCLQCTKSAASWKKKSADFSK